MVQAAELRVLGTLQSERLIVVTRQQQSSDKSTRGKRGGERQRGRESVRENETLTRRMNEVRSPSSREKRLEESAVEFHVLGLGLLDLLDLLRPKPSFRTPVARHSTTQVPSMHLHEPATTIPPRTSTFFHISTRYWCFLPQYGPVVGQKKDGTSTASRTRSISRQDFTNLLQTLYL
jgi:hypothetical protein